MTPTTITKKEFSDAYQKGLNRTIAFLVSRGVPHEQAPDSAQSAWLRGWERLEQLRDSSMLQFWINQIALNHYRHTLRRTKREEEWKPVYQDVASTKQNTAAIDLSTILQACGSEHTRWLKAQLEGQSPRELAKQEGVTPTAIRIRMFRARKAARKWCESAHPAAIPAAA